MSASPFSSPWRRARRLSAVARGRRDRRPNSQADGCSYPLLSQNGARQNSPNPSPSATACGPDRYLDPTRGVPLATRHDSETACQSSRVRRQGYQSNRQRTNVGKRGDGDEVGSGVSNDRRFLAQCAESSGPTSCRYSRTRPAASAASATKEQVEGHPRREAVFAFDLETQSCVPTRTLLPIFHVKDWNQYLSALKSVRSGPTSRA